MTAARYDITIDQGSDYALDMTVKEDGTAKDLTGYSARAQLRSKKHSVSTIADFTCTIAAPLTGGVLMSLSNSTTKAIDSGIYAYDLELFTAGDASVIRILYGEAEIRGEVTR